MKTCLTTRSGKLLDFVNPDPAHILLEDIAISLAGERRFSGQMDMSVAQHCVNVKIVTEALGGSLRDERTALFHDASEFILRDLASPLKTILPDYYQFEDGLMKAIAAKFDFDWPVPDVVKKADKFMLVTEARAHLHADAQWAINEEYGFPADIDAWTVPKGRWLDTILDRDAAAILFLEHAALVL